MNDHIAGEDLAAYVDGILAPGKAAEMESHFSRCPDCLAALADIVAMQGSRARIPDEFLRRALGRGQTVRKAVLPVRLVFEIAAAFLVVVVIGYFSLGGNRFWQGENGREQGAVVTGKSIPAELPEVEKAVPAVSRQAGPGGNGMAKKDLAAGNPMALPAPAKPLEKKMEPAAAGKDRRSLARDKKEMGTMKLEQEPAAILALREGADKMNDAEAVRTRAAEAPGAMGAGQPVLAAKAQAAPPPGKGKEGGEPAPRLLIEGDVSRADLLDPGPLNGWAWFRKGLVLELVIDPDGTVSAVIPVGTWERAAADQAEKSARQLAFSVSARKSRRARISVSGSAPN